MLATVLLSITPIGISAQAIFKNRGFLREHVKQTDFGNYAGIWAGDFDGDGDIDILVGHEAENTPGDTTYQGKIVLIENIDGELYYKGFLKDISGNMIRIPYSNTTPFMADGDGDGDLDLYIGTEIPAKNTNGRIFVYKNDGHGNFTYSGLMKDIFGDEIEYGAEFLRPAFKDLNCDGKPDLIVGRSDGSLTYYINDGTDGVTNFTYHNPLKDKATNDYISVGYRAKPYIVDIDEDNDYDILVGADDGKIHFLRNDDGCLTGSGTYTYLTDAGCLQDPQGNDIVFDQNYTVYPVFIDLNNDTHPDLIVSAGNTVKSYLNDGNGHFTYEKTYYFYKDTSNIDVGHTAVPFAIDFDGDNDFDLLIGNDTGHVLVYENRGGVFYKIGYVTENGQPIDVGDNAAPFFATINGKDSLFIGNKNGSIRIYQQVQDGEFTLLDSLKADGQYIYNDGTVGFYTRPYFGDYDGDGDIDMITGSYDNLNDWSTIRMYENDGSGNFSDKGNLQFHWTAYNVSGTYNSLDGYVRIRPAMADLDGDGDMDVYSGEDGLIMFLQQVGNPEYELDTMRSNGVPISVGDWATPLFIDFDDDGDLDMLVGDDQGYIEYFEHLNSYNVSTSVTPSNAGYVSGSGTYTQETNVTLTATANNNFRFDHWESGSGIKMGTNNPLTFSITRDTTIIAVFTQLYDVNFYVRDNHLNPLEGATIIICQEGTQSCDTLQTNSNGEATFRNLEQGNFTYEVSLIGYITQTGSFDPSLAPNPIEINMPPSSLTRVEQFPKGTYVYPNPLHDKLGIKTYPDRINSIEIYTLSGHKIYEQARINSSHIDVNLGWLNSGMYILRIRTEGKVFVHKIIKE